MQRSVSRGEGPRPARRFAGAFLTRDTSAATAIDEQPVDRASWPCHGRDPALREGGPMTVLVTGGQRPPRGEPGAPPARRWVTPSGSWCAQESDNRGLDGLRVERALGDCATWPPCAPPSRAAAQVYHCAAKVSTARRGEREIFACNVIGTRHVLRPRGSPASRAWSCPAPSAPSAMTRRGRATRRCRSTRSGRYCRTPGPRCSSSTSA